MAIQLSKSVESIDRFVFEASQCAEKELGFAAIATAFCVIQAIGEALLGPGKSDSELIKAFLDQMPNKNRWIKARDGRSISNSEVNEVMINIRHALAHQISLPNNVGLINLIENHETFFASRKNKKFVIGTIEFIEDVKITSAEIVTRNPSKILDPNPPRLVPRSPGKRIEDIRSISSATETNMSGSAGDDD